jgi:hypothetical protein
MAVFSPDFSTAPINQQSKVIEERFFEELVSTSRNSLSIAQEVYAHQVPNVRSEAKPMSARMARFRQAGLIGCFNGTGVTSSNYKEIIYGSFDPDSNN